jgi:hypothetical protein
MAVIASLRALVVTEVNLLRYHVEWIVVLSGLANAATCCSVILITITLSPNGPMAHAHEYRYAPMCLCASLCTCACQPHCTCTSMTLCACLVQRAHICVPYDGVCVSHPNAPPATSERHEQAALTKLWDTMTPSHNRIPPCRGSMARRPYIWFLRPSAIDTGDSQNCESSSERRPNGPQKRINYKQTKKGLLPKHSCFLAGAGCSRDFFSMPTSSNISSCLSISELLFPNRRHHLMACLPIAPYSAALRRRRGCTRRSSRAQAVVDYWGRYPARSCKGFDR